MILVTADAKRASDRRTRKQQQKVHKVVGDNRKVNELVYDSLCRKNSERQCIHRIA